MIKKIILVGGFIVSAFVCISAQTNKRTSLKDTIKDFSIQVPKELENNLEQLVIDWRKSYQKNSGCNLGFSSEVMIPDSVYINRLYSLPSQMELPYNQIVKSYIDMYALRKYQSVSYMLTKGEYYFPMIEETLDKYGLPLELKYLPVIESALNPIAKSRVGATGLWQFMLYTGKLYDLEVNSLVDERKDPKKATEAAARYLKDMYDIYGDWNLVIAAYNCGPGNVNKAIRRSGGQTDYWAIYPYLPRETRGYVPAFIAATYIMNYHDKHNICPAEERTLPVMVDTITINKNLHLQQISQTINIPIEDLRMLNPQYQKDIIPGDYKSYSLRLPSRYTASFIKSEDSIFSYKSSEFLAHRKTVEVDDSRASSVSSGKASKTHKVRRGESLGSIARKYGVTVAHIKRMNNLKSNKIASGRTLVINRSTITPKPKPQAKEEPVLAENNSKKETKKADNNTVEAKAPDSNNFFDEYYKNRKQDNSEEKQETQEADNNIAEETTPTEEAPSDRDHFEDTRTIYHKVRIGETLQIIANKYKVEPKDLQNWNNFQSKKLKIGQRLMVKLPEQPLKKEVENAVKAEEAGDNTVISADTQSISRNELEQKIIEQAVERKTQEEIEKKAVAEKSTKKTATKTPSRRKTHVVKKGETLSSIAEKYKGITVRDIKTANRLSSNKLRIGQKLNIPAK